MKIDAVDFFYLSVPAVTDAGDGSQDALLARVHAGGMEAWGECEASPLTSIASFVCPKSHGACRPVGESVLGEDVSSPTDIARIAAAIDWNSMDLLQAAHTWSGVEVALWNLLGMKRGEPVYRLLGYERAYPKMPYASQLFGDMAEHRLCEYPLQPQPLAWEISRNHIGPDANGEVRVPDAPGLGIEMDRQAMAKYLVDAEIRVGGKVLYRTPAL